ncbi:MAG: DUF1385 domain-containing protein [Lachnospiraceae bacterium]|nr:DUF1385 domain-containing protein [Lachnospiraceae bacterium]
MKSSGIGGQAVLEGVMMKNGSQYAVAVRKPDQEIEIKKDTFTSWKEKISLFKLPIFRGVAAFVESLVLGMRTLNYSASFYEDEEDSKKKETSKTKESLMDAGVMVLSVVMAIVIFILFPLFISNLLGKVIESQTLQLVLEGVLRIVMFIGYVLLISKMEDIRRVFMYHGAEHKCINCIERGYELTVANVRKQSRAHKRCGTSFMLLVMLVSFVLFMFIRVEEVWLRYVLRIVLIPVISGISYEFIRLAGNSDNKLVDILSKPGMLMQSLTTREPDNSMIEVAIASVEAVFDWREYQTKEGIARYKATTKANEEKNTNKRASKGRKMREQKAVLQENVSEELDELTSLDKVFAMPEQTGRAGMQDMAELEAAAAREKQADLKQKVRAGFDMDVDSMGASGDEEEDEVLRALDRYFVYEGEKTVIETVQPTKRERSREKG